MWVRKVSRHQTTSDPSPGQSIHARQYSPLSLTGCHVAWEMRRAGKLKRPHSPRGVKGSRFTAIHADVHVGSVCIPGTSAEDRRWPHLGWQWGTKWKRAVRGSSVKGFQACSRSRQRWGEMEFWKCILVAARHSQHILKISWQVRHSGAYLLIPAPGKQAVRTLGV